MITYRALPAWIHPDQPVRGALFRTTLDQTLRQLEAEVAAVDGRDLSVGLVVRPGSIRRDGTGLLADGRVVDDGVEVAFTDARGRRLSFHTRTHRGWRTYWSTEGLERRVEGWHDNLRAIVLGLEALRAVERYGIADAGEQWGGFAALPAGETDSVERGRQLVELLGSVTAALRETHPDRGGDADAFQDVIAYRESIGS